MGFKALAKKSLEDYFSPNGEELIEQAKSLVLFDYTNYYKNVLMLLANSASDAIVFEIIS